MTENQTYYDKYRNWKLEESEGKINMTTVHKNFRELLWENVEKPTNFTSLDEKRQKELWLILRYFGDAALVDIYLEYFGELPPICNNDYIWSICAIQKGKLDMLKRMYYHRIDLDKINDFSKSYCDNLKPLEYALKNEEIFDYLLEMGAKPRIYSFGEKACHSNDVMQRNLKKIWDLDPSSYEDELPFVFIYNDLEACKWLKKIGAKFSSRIILFYACKNLWTEFVLDLISNMHAFTPEKLNIYIPYERKSPIEAAYAQKIKIRNSGKVCKFIDTLLLHYPDQIEEAMLIPIVCESGKCQFSKCASDNHVYKLPCGHKIHECCLSNDNSSCPICAKFKYKLKWKFCYQ